MLDIAEPNGDVLKLYDAYSVLDTISSTTSMIASSLCFEQIQFETKRLSQSIV